MWKIGLFAGFMIAGGSLVAMIVSQPDVVPPAAAAVAFTSAQLDADTVLLVHRDRGLKRDTIGLDSETLRRLAAVTTLDVWDYGDILECDDPAELRGCTYLAPHPGLEIIRPAVVDTLALITVGVTRLHANGRTVVFESYAVLLEPDELKRWQVTGFQRAAH